MLGVKWQMDVKYVPLECYSGNGEREQHYQYTVIDEANRKRFIYAYKDIGQQSTIDFVLRAFKFFGYRPKIIQTDNGGELRSGTLRPKTGAYICLINYAAHFGDRA